MNMMLTLRNTAARLLGHRHGRPTPSTEQQARIAEQNTAAGRTIANYIRSQGLNAEGLEVKYDRPTETLFVYGVVKDMATRDKILQCCGNVARVSSVADRMVVVSLAGGRPALLTA